ncbi:MAG: NAD(P)H-binding protein [Chloroflexota bacterium]|nr:NAD(P)H-binding protein [Chloroflexota bacterium]MDE2883615.1 NAD(P)H-binding protein [Chloroflexota bacterium]
MAAPRTILVTGATGYIGGRLVPRLVEKGRPVRVLARDPDRVRSRSWSERVKVAVGDVLDLAALAEALDGVGTAYYLVHSMGSGPGFHELDVRAAHTFGQAAANAGVEHIIYLGGLGAGANLSPHLRSRQECGEALRQGGVAVTEFRAAVVVGAGSISFEMVRYLVERLPVMVCPRWVYSRVQPIAVDDLLDYLVSALDFPACRGRTIEVGGRDVTTYGGMMLGYARARGLHRLMLAVPVLTPRLSSYWVHWFTPIPTDITRALVEGLRNDVVVTDDLAHRLFPHIEPQDYASAIGGVLEELRRSSGGSGLAAPSV